MGVHQCRRCLITIHVNHEGLAHCGDCRLRVVSNSWYCAGGGVSQTLREELAKTNKHTESVEHTKPVRDNGETLAMGVEEHDTFTGAAWVYFSDQASEIKSNTPFNYYEPDIRRDCKCLGVADSRYSVGGGVS